ncbi:MAG: PAS domain-containing sensor histidine kinase [Chitinophagaceae bacterium]|nr:MAG: PAS domain-containing sensor histidine kinase [Chitinophagaceae bacterium]
MEDALPELVSQPFITILKEVIASGKDYSAKDTRVDLVVDGLLQPFYFDFIYKAVPMPDGSFTVLNTATDVTEKRKSLHEVATLNENLQALNEQLGSSNAAYEKLNKLLNESSLELERQRSVLHDYLMQAPAGISIFSGPQLRYELLNERYQMILPGRDLLGKPLFEAVPELVGQPIERMLLNVWETGETLSQHELLVPIALDGDGPLEERYFTFTYQARRDLSGTITGMYGFVYEVTDQVMARKKVEESEQHFRHLADLVPAKISNALPDGEVTFFNQQWLDFSGMSFEEMRDFGYHKMLHPDEIPAFTAGLAKAAATGIPHISEMRFMNTEGQYVWHLNIASPVLDENGIIKMWVGSTTDIEKLKQEEQRKSDFLNMLSHEIKTPITTIKGYVQLLQEVADTGADPMIALSVGKLDKLIRKLTGLIEDMLQFGRLESGSIGIKRETINVNQLVASIVEDYRLIHPGHEFNLQNKDELFITADPDKLGQVFTNLLGNAVKYSPVNKKVNVTVFEDENRQAAISIQDFGIGMDAAQFPKIFDRFYRVEGKLENQFSGFGIGLFIAASVVKNHAGTIDIESEKGKGSTFTVHLPRE